MEKILIIDDDVDFRIMLIKLMERNGFEVRGAANGIEGLNTIREFPASLIITDIIMPEMDGIETIIQIRRDHPEMKLIAVSGGGRIGPTDYLNAARALGAHKVFTKPFDNDEFVSYVHGLLKG
jgi:CheY-like chemotaxis protein